MSIFPPELGFTLTWRPYQERVLRELETGLSDRRLHVVAAPGSGKTVLGLEVMRRLDKATLILCPTLTIRDQWVERLVDLFLPPGSNRPHWISTDLHEPGLLTIATYQALHCACAGEPFEEEPEPEEENGTANGYVDENGRRGGNACDPEVVTALRKAGVGTLVVDEAHHLRTNWWNTLHRVVEALGEINTIALTATPPYDAPQPEWERYRRLCGPVDAEISAPELVLRRNLCPHQDYVYLNSPSPEEQRRIAQFHTNVADFINDVRTNEEFVAALESHPWLNYPERHVEDILSDPEYFFSIAILINEVRGRSVPDGVLKVMGLQGKKLPPLDLDWLEVLLAGRLFKDAKNIGEWDPMLKLIRERLYKIGAIERRQVHLRSAPWLDRLLVSSANKLNSIRQVVNLEHDAMGPDLRMVVLTDYIRKSDMPDWPQDQKPLNRIGVVPIFETIRRECSQDVRLGILSGSLVVVPKSSEDLLRSLCSECGVADGRVYLTSLFHDPRYCRLVVDDDIRSAVGVVTRLFSEGGITCLVGTKSLLGEGWDAPSINALILASSVGSYMLSNQMRGRAIRSDPGNPDKTANVWHLVSLERSSPWGGADLEMLTRRFKAFVGVSFTRDMIENGIDRLGLGSPPFNQKDIDGRNARMIELALDRAGLRQRWEQALDRGGPGRLVEEVKAPDPTLPRLTVRANSFHTLTWETAAWAGFAAASAFSALDAANSAAWLSLSVLLAGMGLIGMPFGIKAVRLMAKHGRSRGSLQQIGQAVLEGLTRAGAIKTDPAKLRAVAEKGGPNAALCSLEGGTSYESSVFLEALQEVLSPVQNPRYLIVKRSILGRRAIEEPRAVPHVIGQKKEWALLFLRAWRRHMGYGALVYTRNVRGRRLLLQSRNADSYERADNAPERVRCWK